MSIPANPRLEAAPYGAQPVAMYAGGQGGPYTAYSPDIIVMSPPASRTATNTAGTFSNPLYRGLYLAWNVTANPGGGQTLALDLQAFDSATGVFYSIMSVPASVTPGGLYLCYPGAGTAPAAGLVAVAPFPLPIFYAVKITHSGAGAWIYSLDGLLLP